MRDGIYKNLPLSKPWRAFLKSCTLDAERGEIAREKCKRAICMDLRQIHPQFRAAFRKRAELTESLLPSFEVFVVEVTSSDLGGQNSPLTNQILVQARALERAGRKGKELERAAYAGALEQTMNAHQRAIEQAILTSGSDSDSKATIGAARDAIESAKIVLIVDAFRADSLELPPARRQVGLDEDLSRVNP